MKNRAESFERRSIWQVTNNKKYRKKALNGDKRVNTLVIGGGLCGLLTAYRLKNVGVDVMVIDDRDNEHNEIFRMSDRSTGKITAQHGIIYSRIAENYDINAAKQYAKVNILACNEYDRIINSEGIDCDYMRVPSMLYTKSIGALDEERRDAKRAGIEMQLTEVSPYDREFSRMFNPHGVLTLKDSASFCPTKFLCAMSEYVDVYSARASEIKNGSVKIDSTTVKADNIIIATHYPMLEFPGLFFLRMYQSRVYMAAFESDVMLSGNYYGIDDDALSLRRYGKYIVCAGPSRRVGEVQSENLYIKLVNNIRKYFGDVKIAKLWSAQDCMTPDGIAYIGKTASSKSKIYVATGFNKWGNSTSMAASIILTDYIVNGKTEYTIFSPSRFGFKSGVKTLASQSFHAVKGYVDHLAKAPKKTDFLEKGKGDITENKYGKCASYRDDSGTLHKVSTKCSHLGCRLEWNNDDKSWDCPCHGSRFDIDGKVIDGPAKKDIGLDG